MIYLSLVVLIAIVAAAINFSAIIFVENAPTIFRSVHRMNDNFNIIVDNKR